MLTIIATHVGNWITNQDIVKENTLKQHAASEVNSPQMNDIEGHDPSINSSEKSISISKSNFSLRSHTDPRLLSLSPIYEDYVLKDLPLIISNYYRYDLNNITPKYLLNENRRITYRYFQSNESENCKPLVNIILLQSGIKRLLGYILHEKYDANVFVMDVCGIDDDVTVHSKDMIYSDIKCLVMHIKNNQPDVPVILGGHGFGASLAINYSGWSRREHVHGYIFVSPVVNIKTSKPLAQQAANLEALRTYYGSYGPLLFQPSFQNWTVRIV
jgi:hypothetical protein